MQALYILFVCTQIFIVDGDTVKGKCIDKDTNNKENIYLRMELIDAPEKKQVFGDKSKQFLINSCQKNVTLHVKKNAKDKYGRKLGFLFCDGKNMNLEQVAQGNAWFYQGPKIKSYSSFEQNFLDKENFAKINRLGLWQDPHPINPSDWRKSQKDKSKK